MDLFVNPAASKKPVVNNRPLAVRMRPKILSEFVGQEHILSEGKLLRRAIESDTLSSLILYGPPGTGKTALAFLISSITQSYFERVNAVSSNSAEIRAIIKRAKEQRRISPGKHTILFIDEIHRFNKAQQDLLMPDVEEGIIILIGATTHNPFFSVISPLLSRSLIFQLTSLSEQEIVLILERALSDKERGLGKFKVRIEPKALVHLAKFSDGDARKALNALEVGVLTASQDKDGIIDWTLEAAQESIQKKAVVYDADEDGHYDTISAFIKSIRGSDPDAAVYWLAKMLHCGEDPRFIARRLVIAAAEDIGNADPQALVIANAALQVSEFVGLPECRIPLAQAVTYLASAPKSNASYLAIDKAMKDVEQGRTLAVPEHLKDASYHGAEKLGRGKDYKYAHNYKGHYVHQEHKPSDTRYYFPTDIGYEKQIKERLQRISRTNR